VHRQHIRTHRIASTDLILVHTPKLKRKVALTTPKFPNQPKPLSLQQQQLTITSSREYSKSVSGTSAIAA
jgi:hypothetical protein